jgi:HK97 gp10 family phage protein
MPDVQLDGMKELLNRLQVLGKKAERIENEALKAGAEILREEISARAPRSSSPRQPKPKTQLWRTGEHAADHISISGVKKIDGVKSVTVGVQKGDNSHYFYLKFFEWGTSKMSARPFMAPALAAKQNEIIEQMKQVIKGGLGL